MTFVPARRGERYPATGPAFSMRTTARRRPARSAVSQCAARRVAAIWRTSGSCSYVKRGWNVTGDAFVVDDEGYFWYQARADDMIVSSGYNIAGPEVEGALLEHPSVAECAVIGVSDEQRGQLVKAYVVLRAPRSGDEALTRELQDFVKNAIAPYKYPRQIEYVAALPRTATGKLQRFRLRGGADGHGTPD